MTQDQMQSAISV